MNARACLALCVLATVVGGGARGDELVAGRWRVEYTAGGIASVAFDGTPVLTQSSFTVFRPDYKEHLFALRQCEVSRRADAAGGHVLEWVEDSPEKGRGVMTLELAGDELQWRVRMRILVGGPVEAALLIPPAAVQSPSGVIHGAIGAGRVQLFEHEFPTRTLAEPLLFDTPARQWRVDVSASAGRWLLQDRRDSQGGLRLIACLRASGVEPLAADVGLRLRVRTYAGDALQARTALFSQRSRTLLEAPVANAGFEAAPPFVEWTHGRTAAVVPGGQAPGKRCARLTVRSKEEKAVYLTQPVPCTPGSRYRARAMVRTEEVKEAEVLGMHSAGAVLIVEWADAERKWLAPGAYAKGRFGTAGWHVQEVNDVLAPPDAAYAIVFLGLRGTGTAWFDDVELYESRRSAVLESPLDGSALADNRPLFTWQRDSTLQAYTILLSQDAAFPPDRTLRARTDEATFRPERKLRSGHWHWRVGLDGDAPCTAWGFTQTAPGDADTTGPRVEATPHSFTEPGGPLVATAFDESGIDPRSVSLLIGGAPVACESRVLDGEEIRVLPSAGWPAGASQVSLRVTDRLGNASAASTWVVHAPPAPEAISWTRDRGVRRGQRHEFPLGMYQVREEELARVKDAGFDLVHIYTWEGSQDDAAARRYLDAVARAGLRAFVGFDRGNASGNGLVQGNLGHVARRIAALRDHPALYAWYLFDEPDLSHQYVSPKDLRGLYAFIKTLDPDHPVIVTLAVGDSPKRYGPCYDVYWSMMYRPTAQLAKGLAQHRAMIGESPLMAIVHSYDQAQTKKLKRGEPIDAEAFWPDHRTLRANALMSVVRGTSGLCWWWFGDHGKQWLATADIPAMWETHRQVVAELRLLEPMLVAPGRDASVSVTCDPDAGSVHARLKVLPDGLLLVAVNASEGAVSARISASELSGTGSLRPADGSGSTVTPQDGGIDLRFGPLAAKALVSRP